jgi:hypothetical protein
VLAAAVSVVAAGSAGASQLIGFDARDVTLQADGSGRALVTFTSGGRIHHVLAGGAIDARPPSRTVPQVAFRLDTRGGSIRNMCAPAKVALAWLVAACRASDGSYWALQSWQRLLPNGGAHPSAKQAAWELRLSHWRGPLARLTVGIGWSFHRFRQIFGVYRYAGKPVFGYRVRSGVPLDGYGRNIYVDAFNSDLGTGWKRVNSFLAHQPIGAFCYGFYPHGGRTGVGSRLRATVIGPGVTPDVVWQAKLTGGYSASVDKAADDEMRSLLRGDTLCRPN